ncbi:MAG: 50S ribosomal protein L3 [Candidatus Coatesbacteria bacterium RBG_13_66_14]|uniref:Large ribosomal subunit protein uL3 n=1 Tax=Candidatus Coatesbacteria bacterium RBG_13_66_14 TaxID=1817816 RepID=A0A1F5F365_9BACT|nr:MAG: 50S ribosomal protein L3 [Candidatus Coatesbacteria bacterium RBG_13_66_14]
MVRELLGRKLGMTQVFDEDLAVPVTVLEVGPCTVTKVRTAAVNGYEALQVGYGEVAPARVSKPRAGQFAKNGLTPTRWLAEVPCDPGDEHKIGDVLDVTTFADVRSVDVRGVTKGRGFAGVIKRYGFSGGPATHGAKFHRAPGSIGACAFPGRVLKGKRLPGHYGNVRFTVLNLNVVRVDAENNLLYVRGAVPGPKGGRIVVRVGRAGVKGE